MLVVGILTLQSKAEVRRAIRRSWKPDPDLVLRFVIRCGSTPPRSDFVCVGSRRGRPKSMEWLMEAPLLFPNASWIAKSDDDTWIHVPHILEELRGLHPDGTLMGLGMIMMKRKPKDVFGGTFDSFDDFSDLSKRGRYPFLQGGFRVYSRDVLHDARMKAQLLRYRRLYERHDGPIGEDAASMRAIERAFPNRTFKIMHMTWSRSHFLQHNWKSHPGGGMGWVHPSNASTVVHWVKYGPQAFRFLRAFSGAGSPPFAFRSFEFRWHPGSRIFAPSNASAWKCYRRVCGAWGCHAPYRGERISTYLNTCT